MRLSTPQAAVVDDYAHHPVAVAGFIDGLRQRYPGRRLVLVFQPHTLTRTRALFDDFVSALRAPEQVAVLDVYAGRESDDLAERRISLATPVCQLLARRTVADDADFI